MQDCTSCILNARLLALRLQDLSSLRESSDMSRAAPKLHTLW